MTDRGVEGGAGLADRTRAELRATGAAADPTADPQAESTSRQREIVRFTARSLCDRETAEHLFRSPHTVGSHLRDAYPTLRVSGWHRLRDLLGDR